ncbi:MAG: asparagine synthase-related protein [Candidatus Woesearchaeota archaeon]
MKQEFFVHDGKLISKPKWEEKINSFRVDHELSDSEDKIVLQIKQLVESAVKERLEGLDEVGIFFSGGLDSSYIAGLCKKFKANFTCYTVGFQDGQFKDPEDIIQARAVAKHLKLHNDEFKEKVFSIKEIEPVMIKTIKILQQGSQTYNTNIVNVVTVGVGAVEVAAHSISKNEKIFFSGLGSEELYAGYERHKLNPTNEECFDGLLKMYERDLLRDTAIPKALKFSFTTPFLDEELACYSLKIPIQYKINNTGSKMILRKAAESLLGLHAQRPKRAAQYGSSFDRALLKLAKIHKLEHKNAYIQKVIQQNL